MELTVLCGYGLLLLGQVVLLAFVLRKPEKNLWPALFGVELISFLGAVGLMFLFDALPGKGFMPGLAWIGEWFYSLLAAGVYLIMLVLTAVLCAIKKK